MVKRSTSKLKGSQKKTATSCFNHFVVIQGGPLPVVNGDLFSAMCKGPHVTPFRTICSGPTNSRAQVECVSTGQPVIVSNPGVASLPSWYMGDETFDVRITNYKSLMMGSNGCDTDKVWPRNLCHNDCGTHAHLEWRKDRLSTNSREFGFCWVQYWPMNGKFDDSFSEKPCRNYDHMHFGVLPKHWSPWMLKNRFPSYK